MRLEKVTKPPNASFEICASSGAAAEEALLPFGRANRGERISTARRLRYYLLLPTVLTLFCCASGQAQEPKIEVRVQRDEIYVGESVVYEVFLNGFEQDALPEFPPSDEFRLELISNTVTSFLSSTTVQGRTTTVRRGGPRLTYELTPTKSGTVNIPAPSAVVDGRKVYGEQLTLRVVAPREQDLVRLRLSQDPMRVYPTQTFRVRLEMDVKGLPDIARNQEPLTVQTLPTLTIPWVNDDELPDGISPTQSRERWLTELAATDRRGGISINGLRGRRDIFSFGMDDLLGRRQRDDRIAFRPQPTKFMAEDQSGAKVEYWKYVFEREFEAERAGDYRFGPVSVKGTFAGRLNSGGKLEGESVYAVADPIFVEVREPPLEGRPDSYVGAIGQFEVGARITPTAAKVGDPMTLTVWMRGSGSLATVEAPQLQQDSEITERFRVYDATQDLQDELQSFTYSVRPLHPEVRAFPAVALAYFDPVSEKYVTKRTPSLPVTVAKAEKLNQSEIAVANGTPRAADGVELSDGGIFANITDLSELTNQRVDPQRWLLGLGGAAGFFLLFVVVVQRLESGTGNRSRKRRRRAASRARSLVRQARSDADEGNTGAVADQLSRAILGLTAAAGDDTDEDSQASRSFTTGDALAALTEFGIGEECVDRCRQVLETCDAMRYGSVSRSPDEIVQQAESVVDDLISSLRQQKRLP